MNRENAERIALLIGVGLYKAAAIPTLSYTVGDACTLSDLLGKMGYKVQELHDTESKKPPSEYISINTNLKKVCIESCDTLLIYYSGHGLRAAGIPFLLPRNAEVIDRLEENYWSDVQKLHNQLKSVILQNLPNVLPQDKHLSFLRDLQRAFTKSIDDFFKKIEEKGFMASIPRDLRDLVLEFKDILPEDSHIRLLDGFDLNSFQRIQDNFLTKARSKNVIPIADVIRQMNDSPARQKILIIDACFAGIDLDNLTADLSQLFYDATGSPGSHKTNDDHTKVADEGKKRYGGYALFYEAEGFAMLAASTGSQVSRESVALKHGYFTYHLLNGLGGKPDKDGKRDNNPLALRDNKPFITVTDIALYTAQQLRNMSWGAGFQEPTSLMAMKGDMILVESQDFRPDYRPLIVPRRMVFRYNARFVSREEALGSLKGAFVDSQGKETKVAVATGMGGIGKTQVAGQFIYERERDFPGGVFWLNFAKGEQIKSEIADCGSNMYMNLKDFDENNIEKSYGLVVAEWNRKDAPRRLLIFDNCEDPKLLVTYLPNPDSNCCVLVTSRRQRWFESQQGSEGLVSFSSENLSNKLELSEDEKKKIRGFSHNLLLLPLVELTEVDSVELLKKFREFNSGDDDNLREIAERVGHLPLALHLSGSVLSTVKTAKGLIDPAEYANKLTSDPFISEYVKQLAERTRSQDGTPSGDEPNLPTHHALILPTFVMSYEQLKRKDALDDLARKLLFRAASFKPNEPIPAYLLIQSLPDFPPAPSEDEESSKKQEQQRQHDEFVKKAKDALERLVNLGLLDWSGRFDVEGYVIHPLVALFVQTIKDALNNEAKRRETEAEAIEAKAAEAKKAEKGYEELTKEAAELRSGIDSLSKEAEQLPSELETAQADVERAMYWEAKALSDDENILGTMKIQAHLRYITDAAMKRHSESSSSNLSGESTQQ